MLQNVESWLPSGRWLYESILKWEQAHDHDEKERAKAEPIILNALLSGKVLFKGERAGLQQDIDVTQFELDDLVGASVFLASEAAAYVTGQILFIDGGYMASV